MAATACVLSVGEAEPELWAVPAGAATEEQQATLRLARTADIVLRRSTLVIVAVGDCGQQHVGREGGGCEKRGNSSWCGPSLGAGCMQRGAGAGKHPLWLRDTRISRNGKSKAILGGCPT